MKRLLVPLFLVGALILAPLVALAEEKSSYEIPEKLTEPADEASQ